MLHLCVAILYTGQCMFVLIIVKLHYIVYYKIGIESWIGTNEEELYG